MCIDPFPSILWFDKKIKLFKELGVKKNVVDSIPYKHMCDSMILIVFFFLSNH